MRSSIVFGLVALVGLTAAIPKPEVDTDYYTPGDVDDGFPAANITRRGYDHDDCPECPPEPCDKCEHKRWKGCMYIECSNDCDTEDCCECIGLNPYRPYFLYYNGDPPSTTSHNIQVYPTLPYHDFWYDEYDHHYYIDEKSKYGIYFDQSPNYKYGEFTIGLSPTYSLADFYSKHGSVSVSKKYDYDNYWVCKDSAGILRVFYQDHKPTYDTCCPVKVYFTNKVRHHEYDDDYHGHYDHDHKYDYDHDDKYHKHDYDHDDKYHKHDYDHDDKYDHDRKHDYDHDDKYDHDHKHKYDYDDKDKKHY